MKITAILRWLLASGCLWFCFKQFSRALKMEGYGAAPFLIFGYASFIAALLLISPETITRACEFFSRIFTNVILPDDKSSKPPLSYLLARRYAHQLRFREAVAEYQSILRHYPKEEDAYHELVAVAHACDNGQLAEKTIRLYEKRFRRGYMPPFPQENQRSGH